MPPPVAASPAAALRVQVADQPAELEGLRPFWQHWQSHPTIEWGACRALVAKSGGRARTVAFVLGELAAPRAALVAMSQDTRVPVQLGYWRIANPRIGVLTVKHGGGWLGPADDAGAAAIFAAMVGEMRSRGAAMLHLEHFPADHPLVRAATAAGASPVRPEPDVNWRVAIPGSWAEFLAACSKNTRRNLKRYPERFLEEFGSRSTVHVYRDPGDLARIVAEMDEVARHSYHRGLGAGFLKAPEQIALIEAALAAGTYRAFLLHIDGRPAAFWDGRRCGGVFYTDFTAYLPSYRDARPGWYLLSRVLEHLCGDTDVQWIDFGQGDAQYKQMLGTTSAAEVSLAIYAPTLRGRSLRALVRTTAGTTRVLRRTLDRLGVLQKVKSLWRRRLAADTPAEGAE